MAEQEDLSGLITFNELAVRANLTLRQTYRLVASLDKTGALGSKIRKRLPGEQNVRRLFTSDQVDVVLGIIYFAELSKANQITFTDITQNTNYSRTTISILVKELDELGMLAPPSFRNGEKRGRKRTFSQKDYETVLGTIYAAAKQRSAATTIDRLAEQTGFSRFRLNKLVKQLDEAGRLGPPQHKAFSAAPARVFSARDTETIKNAVSEIEREKQDSVTLTRIANHARLSRNKVAHLVKELTELNLIAQPTGTYPRRFNADDTVTILSIIWIAAVEAAQKRTITDLVSRTGYSHWEVRDLVQRLDDLGMLSEPTKDEKDRKLRIFSAEDYEVILGTIHAVETWEEQAITFNTLAELTGFSRLTIRDLVKELDQQHELDPKTFKKYQGRQVRSFTPKDTETILGVIYAHAASFAHDVTILSITKQTGYSKQQLWKLVKDLDELGQLDPPQKRPRPRGPQARVFSTRDQQTILGTIHATEIRLAESVTIKDIAQQTGYSTGRISEFISQLDQSRQLDPPIFAKGRGNRRLLSAEDAATITGRLEPSQPTRPTR